MNPLTNVKNIQKLNERELQLGIIGKKSWHDEYKDSAWVFTGGLPYDLTEGDIICVFSQYGEVVNLNLIRDNKSGKSKGYGFLCYEDQRSTVLAVDNLNGTKILGRTIRVDHVKDYKIPKEHGDEDEATVKMRDQGCAPKLNLTSEDEMAEVKAEGTDRKQSKKEKSSKKQKKKKKNREASSSNSSSDSDGEGSQTRPSVKIKQERFDKGYEQTGASSSGSDVRQRRENGHRLEGNHFGADFRSSSQRSNGDLRHRDGDDESGREREVSPRRDYGTDRAEANGSHRKNEFNRLLDSNTFERDRSREKGYNYKGGDRNRDWGGGNDLGGDWSRESGSYREGGKKNYGTDWNRENNNFKSRDNQRYGERSNNIWRDSGRDQSWDRQGGKDKYRKEEENERYSSNDNRKREGRVRDRHRESRD